MGADGRRRAVAAEQARPALHATRTGAACDLHGRPHRRRRDALIAWKSEHQLVADFLLAIDQGTTSSRAILFDGALQPIAVAQQEFRQIYPAPGHVEHDPEEIWSSVVGTVRAAFAKAGATARDVAA